MKRFALVVFGAGSLAAMSASAMADTDTFTATATTQAALTVTCTENLRFGNIGIEPTNNAATITVEAVANDTADSTDVTVYPASGSGPAKCDVANEDGANATASLAATGASWVAPTLSGVTLTDGTNNLTATATLSETTNIGDGTTGGDILYVGGTLSIPAAHTVFSTYSATLTLTVTD